jgi:kinesin family protein 11
VGEFDGRMKALDDLVSRARSKNAQNCDANAKAVRMVSETVESTYGSISQHFGATFERTKNLGEEINAETDNAERNINATKAMLCAPVAELRENTTKSALKEYESTGDTPQPTRYQFPTQLPPTESSNMVIADMQDMSSPSKPVGSLAIFRDSLEKGEPIPAPLKISASLGHNSGSTSTSLLTENVNLPTLKKRRISSGKKEGGVEAEAEGKENVVSNLSASRGQKRKSPRLSVL